MIDFSGKFLDILVPVFRPKLARGDSNFPLIQSKPNVMRPNRDYATLDVLNIEEAGQLETGVITESGMQVKKHYNVTVRVNVYGRGAITRAYILKNSLEYPSMTEKMTNIGVCWRGATNIVDLSALVSTEIEERASFDIRLGTVDGDFAVEEKDFSKDGLPSQGSFDEDIVPVESVTVDVLVAENPTTIDDFTSVGQVTVDLNN